MIDEIRQEVVRRGITRVCHFTPSRNLAHIANDKIGLLATTHLKTHERAVLNATDLQRLDQHEEYICCSIEYPNPWYFEKARAQETLFPDWVVVFIKPECLWRDGTLFCARNAAAGGGAYLRAGLDSFRELYAESVRGARGNTYRRTATRLSSVPTDDQAEVLIPDSIALSDVLGIAVASTEQARNELARLRLVGVRPDAFRIVTAPSLFQKNELSRMMRIGLRPGETT